MTPRRKKVWLLHNLRGSCQKKKKKGTLCSPYQAMQSEWERKPVCCGALKFSLSKLLEDPKPLTSRCKVLGLELERNGWYFLMQTPWLETLPLQPFFSQPGQWNGRPGMRICLVMVTLLGPFVIRKKYTRVRNEILSVCVIALEHWAQSLWSERTDCYLLGPCVCWVLCITLCPCLLLHFFVHNPRLSFLNGVFNFFLFSHFM